MRDEADKIDSDPSLPKGSVILKVNIILAIKWLKKLFRKLTN